MLVSIQILRAIAAIMVVAFHAGHGGDGFLVSGVDIFFVISGFVMVQSTSAKAVSTLSFYTARLTRIVPLYYLATVTFAVVLLAMEHRFPSWREFLLSGAFVPYRDPSGDILPILGVGWTLNYEMLFYLLFGLTLYLGSKRQLIALFLIFGMMVSSRWIFGHDTAITQRFTNPVLFEFMAGCVLGLMWNYRSWLARVPKELFYVALAVGASALVIDPMLAPGAPRAIIFGGPAIVIVATVLSLEGTIRTLSVKPLVVLGNASYALYLFHVPAITILRPAIDNRAVLVLASIVVGICVHFLVERPILLFLRRNRIQRTIPPSPIPQAR